MIAATSPPAAPSALLGRSAELSALSQAVIAPGTRLLTITGPPGVGKTRLALAAAGAVADHFAGGTAWIELAVISDERLVLPEIARGLGVARVAGESVVDRIATAVAERDVLIILDNCEHL